MPVLQRCTEIAKGIEVLLCLSVISEVQNFAPTLLLECCLPCSTSFSATINRSITSSGDHYQLIKSYCAAAVASVGYDCGSHLDRCIWCPWVCWCSRFALRNAVRYAGRGPYFFGGVELSWTHPDRLQIRFLALYARLAAPAIVLFVDCKPYRCRIFPTAARLKRP